MNNRIFLTLDEQAVLKAIEDRFYKTGKASAPKTPVAWNLAMNLASYGRLHVVKKGGDVVGFTPRFYISPKRDFGDRVWIVSNGFENIMPGQIWFNTVAEAMRSLKSLIDAKFDADEFWRLQIGKKIFVSRHVSMGSNGKIRVDLASVRFMDNG